MQQIVDFTSLASSLLKRQSLTIHQDSRQKIPSASSDSRQKIPSGGSQISRRAMICEMHVPIFPLQTVSLF